MEQEPGSSTATTSGEVPPRVEYSLTPFGVSLTVALRPLCDWGSKHMACIEETKSNGEAKKCEATASSSGCS